VSFAFFADTTFDMALEIERKFLVVGESWRTRNPEYICQGYLNHDKHRTVRVRIKGRAAYLTIKGKSTGATRSEFEYAIPIDDARQLMTLCENPPVEKYRHTLQQEGSTWEVDEFLGENLGLILAEIELNSEDQPFSRPDWLGKEVTDDPRYYNANLAISSFSKW